jgi:hypothetical protein
VDLNQLALMVNGATIDKITNQETEVFLKEVGSLSMDELNQLEALISPVTPIGGQLKKVGKTGFNHSALIVIYRTKVDLFTQEIGPESDPIVLLSNMEKFFSDPLFAIYLWQRLVEMTAFHNTPKMQSITDFLLGHLTTMVQGVE